MIITCPHCHTNYQVADQAIGENGRSVQCASCHQSWHADRASARPPAAQVAVSSEEEEALDAAMGAAEPAPAIPVKTKTEPPADEPAETGEEPPATAKGKSRRKRRGLGERAQARVAARRRRAIAARLPAARIRRIFGSTMLVAAVAILIGFFALAGPIVRLVPDLASLYRLVGMDINIVGLDFSDVRTVRASNNGHELLVIEARVSNVTEKLVYVPSVRVTLNDAEGEQIYEWSVVPNAAVLQAGESMKFETQLAAPPPNVAAVRLRFEPGKRIPETPSIVTNSVRGQN